MQEQGRNVSMRLVGENKFEDVRLGGEFLHQGVRWIERQRLQPGEMAQYGKNIFVRGGDGQIETRAAELQLCTALEKMPGEAGAKSDGTLEARIANVRGGRYFVSGREMRIENEEHAKIFLVRKFADHQIAKTRGGFPVHVPRAVVGQIFAERI